MKDLVYKISSVLLYDNQLEHDYFILYNRTAGYLFGSSVAGISSDIPYSISRALKDIYMLTRDENFNEKSISMIRDSSLNENNVKFINIKDFVTLVKVSVTHLPNYNGYDIYWNETKSGINIHDYELAGVWSPGSSSYSMYRLFENKSERIAPERERKLSQLLEL